MWRRRNTAVPTILALTLALVSVVTAPAPLRSGGPLLAAAQAPAQASAPEAASKAAQTWPIGVDLMTLVDHSALFAGHRVGLPAARVERLVGPNLVLIGYPRRWGNYPSYRANRWDRLLVLLPSGAAVPRHDLLVVTGTVRTVRGAQVSGQLAGVNDAVLKQWRNAALLVAESVRTADGVDLGGRR
jgi:hypothetical protein